MLDFLLFSFIGALIGIILGLIPGMHINNILPIVLSLSIFFNPINLAVLIVSISISQIFISYIPSIFLGAPEENTALSILPGHKLLLEGKGFEAIILVVFSGIFSMFLTLFLIFLFSNYFAEFYEISRPYIHYVLIFLIVFMMIHEKNIRIAALSFFIFSLSGVLGTLVLNSTIISTKLVLFPILSGLFGLSTLIVSFSQSSKIPNQEFDQNVKIFSNSFFKSVFLGSIAGIIVGFLPAIGVSQAAIFMQYIGKMSEAKNFLMTLSSINVSNEIFSIISLFLIGNPRSGASVALEKILSYMDLKDVFILLGSLCFSASISAFLTIKISKVVIKFLIRINYKLLSFLIFAFLTIMIFILTGFPGLLVAFTSTSIGFLCNQLKVKRSYCMGVLLLPSIFFFANLNPLIISILRI